MHHPIQFLRGCIGIRGVGSLALRRPIRRVRVVISGRLPIIKRNESAEHSRMHVRSLACACAQARDCVRVSVVFRQEGRDRTRTVCIFFPDVPGGRRCGHPPSSATQRRSPFDDERKKGGKARSVGKLSIRRSIQAVACEQPPLSGMQKVTRNGLNRPGVRATLDRKSAGVATLDWESRTRQRFSWMPRGFRALAQICSLRYSGQLDES